MKVLFLCALLSLTAESFAGVYYDCDPTDRRFITLFIDFNNKDITVAQGNRVIATERMTQIDRGFRQVGESMSRIRSATTASGKVSIQKNGSHIRGIYQGGLSFGDRLDLICNEVTDSN